MTRRSIYATTPENIGNFGIGERIPLKGCWFHVAHIEEGVMVLALTGFTKRGQEIVAELRAKQEINENSSYSSDSSIHAND